MRQLKLPFILITFAVLLYSCKKEVQYNTQPVVYKHVYGLKSNSTDTLYSVYIPNAFTPDGDGINDEFYPKGYFNLIHFRIYDKWGKIIFATQTNPYVKWNGTMNGVGSKIVDAGNYMYQFIVNDANGIDHEYTGGLMLCK